MYEGALDLVGRRVPQHEQRIEPGERLERLGDLLACPFETLRLIDDDDGAVRGDHVDRPAGLEVVQHVVDPPVVLAGRVEGLDVDDHDLHSGVRTVSLELVQPAGVVDEGTGLGAVLLLEVVTGDLERLHDALTDRDGGDDDDVLAPSVAPVQLHDRLDIDVGLAGACLHLDVEVRCAWRGGAVLELIALRKVAARVELHGLDVPQELPVAQGDLGVAESGVVASALLTTHARVQAVADAVAAGLPGEAVDDGVDRIGLVLLMLELELHGDPWSVGAAVRNVGHTALRSGGCLRQRKGENMLTWGDAGGPVRRRCLLVFLMFECPAAQDRGPSEVAAANQRCGSCPPCACVSGDWRRERGADSR